MELNIGRIPPHDIEIEEAILGAMMLDRNTIVEVIHKLTPEHFYHPNHAEIYNCIAALFHQNEPVDLITVHTKAQELGKLDKMGGAQTIARISGKLASTANVEFYASVLVELYTKRMAIVVGTSLIDKSFSKETDPFETIGQAATDIFNLTSAAMRKQVTKFSDGLKKVLTDLDTPFTKDGLQTGFPAVDNMLGGFQPSDLVVIAARPGMGKTALMCAMMRHISGTGNGVGVFSLEMSEDQIIRRMLGAEAKIPTYKFRTSNLTENDWTHIHAIPAGFDTLPIQIDDSAGLSLTELQAKARQMHTRGAKIIFVDYLQLIKSSGRSREQEVAEVSRGLKNLAKSLSIPVVALAQLNRGVEDRADKRPMLSDLRESGEIENSADAVGFLVRPEYYKHDSFEYKGERISSAGKAIFDIQKNRHGATCDLLINFDKEITTFLP